MASRNLSDCVPELQAKIPLIIKDYNTLFLDRTLFITCTLRSTLEQVQLFAVGRTREPIGKSYIVTWQDGLTRCSMHNPLPDQPLSRAVDLGVLIGGKYMGKDIYYRPLLDLARKYNLISGWDFRNSGLPMDQLIGDGHFHDAPHIETKSKV